MAKINTYLITILFVFSLQINTHEGWEATGKLYDKFTLEKREGLPNLLLEALPQENRK